MRALSEIALALGTSVEEQAGAMREIASSVQHVSGATTGAAQAMREVCDVVNGADTATRDVMHAADEVSQAAAALDQHIGGFLRAMENPVLAEHRESQRIDNPSITATLSLDGQAVGEVKILNIAYGGMAIQTPRTAPTGSPASVSFPSLGKPLAGTVLRASDGTLAVQFGDDDATRTNVTLLMSRLSSAVPSNQARAA